MKKNERSFLSMSVRLFKIAGLVKGKLTVSTLASILGNAAHLGIMGFGSMMLLTYAGYTEGVAAWVWGVWMAVCGLTITVCRYVEGMVSHAGAFQLLADMRVKMFDTVRNLAPACLVDRQKGDILSIAVADIETIESFFAHTIGPVFTVIILPLVTLTIAGCVDLLFVWVLLPLYLITSVLLPYIALRIGRNVGRDYRVQVGALKSQVLESVYGVRDIQSFGIGDEKKEEVLDTTRKINHTAHLLTMHRQLVTSAPTFFIYLARIMIVAIASYLALNGQHDPVGIVVLSFVVAASFSSTQSLTTVVTNLLETYAAAERIFDLEDAEPEVMEDEHPVEPGPIESIEFKDVSFHYPGSKAQTLDHLNLTIRPREKIGVVGESGIGKSTIIRLLLRFWEVTGGEILVNGIPLKKLSLSSLRSRIALLEQDTFIFSDTIEGNIAFGRPGASHEEIVTAAKRAGIHDFIETLPDGYATHMGELGGRLSGGEKQRIGIARVMLTDPDMLVMDEPTSSLDILNEKGLLKTLEEEYDDKMILLVSHRPSTLTGCTRILRLSGGALAPAAE